MKKNLLFLKVTLKGNNLKYLVGYLQNKNVGVYGFTESKEEIKIIIDYIDRRKFFDICKNMCYDNCNSRIKPCFKKIFSCGICGKLAKFSIDLLSLL